MNKPWIRRIFKHFRPHLIPDLQLIKPEYDEVSQTVEEENNKEE